MTIEMGESLVASWLKHVKCCQIVQANWKYSTSWKKVSGEKARNKRHYEIELLVKEAQDKLGILKRKQTKNVGAVVDCMFRQVECDVLGVRFGTDVPEYIATEIAFHGKGLHYTPPKSSVIENAIDFTAHKIITKMFSTAMVLYWSLGVKKAQLIFASPKTIPSFETEIIKKVKSLKDFFRKHKKFEYSFDFITNKRFKTEIYECVKEKIGEVADVSELYMRAILLSDVVEGEGDSEYEEVKSESDEEDRDEAIALTHDANFKKACSILGLTSDVLKEAIKDEVALYEKLVELRGSGKDDCGWAQMGLRETYRRMFDLDKRPTFRDLEKRCRKRQNDLPIPPGGCRIRRK